jgi:hypothetical protein
MPVDAPLGYHQKLQEAYEAVIKYENKSIAASHLGIHVNTLKSRYYRAVELGYGEKNQKLKVEELSECNETIDELIKRRKSEYSRIKKNWDDRHEAKARVPIEGPIGIAWFGDPHLDDPGCDIELVEHHINILNKTKGLYGVALGDYTNNWIGRLERLYADQSTTKSEAYLLAEWFFKSVDWFFLLGGNHDAWAGSGLADPITWIAKSCGLTYEHQSLRVILNFPNKKEVRIDARHKHKGFSMWNPAHGVSRTVRLKGFRDHLVVGGDKHISGFQPHVDPKTRLITHAIQVASYEIISRYAHEQDLDDHWIFCCPVTIIDPQYEDNDTRLLTTFFDPQEASEYLEYKRKKWSK